MFFEDPIRTIDVELPAGWSYNVFESTLTDFYFTRWDCPSEIVGVHVRPASVPQDEPNESWIQQIQSHVGEKVVLTPGELETGCILVANFGSDQGPAQRVAFIRGPKVELVVEQRSLERQPDRWAPLELAARTVVSAVNFGKFKGSGVEEFNQCMDNANQALGKQDFPAVITALQQAIDIGTFAWLYSLAPPVNSPDLNAAVRVAQAMMHAAGITGDSLMQRNSECVLRRSLCTLERMESSDEVERMKKDLTQALDLMIAELLDRTEEKASGAVSPVLAMRERAFRSIRFAEDALSGPDFENAYNLSGLAADDLIALLSLFRRPQAQPEEIPEEIAAHLVGQGITDPAAQRETLRKARESFLLPPLVSALQLRFCCALQLGTFGFTDAAETLLPIARLLHSENPDDSGIAMNLALSWTLCAGAAILQSGDQSIKNTEQYLGNAEQVLGSIVDASGADTGWIRFQDRHFEGILQALQRRLARLEEEEHSDERKVLAGICSRFEKLSAEFRHRAGAAPAK